MTGCIHHWRIETPVAKTSHGVCKRCGEEREFVSWEGAGCEGCGGLRLKGHICHKRKKTRRSGHWSMK